MDEANEEKTGAKEDETDVTLVYRCTGSRYPCATRPHHRASKDAATSVHRDRHGLTGEGRLINLERGAVALVTHDAEISGQHVTQLHRHEGSGNHECRAVNQSPLHFRLWARFSNV